MLGYVGQESALARVPFASLGLFYTLRVPELVVPLEIDIGYFSYEWSSFAGNVENVVHAIPIVVSTGYEIQLIAGQLTLTPGLGVGYGLHLTSSATTDEALQASGERSLVLLRPSLAVALTLQRLTVAFRIDGTVAHDLYTAPGEFDYFLVPSLSAGIDI